MGVLKTLRCLNSTVAESVWTDIPQINNKRLLNHYWTIYIEDCKKETVNYLALFKLVITKVSNVSSNAHMHLSFYQGQMHSQGGHSWEKSSRK